MAKDCPSNRGPYHGSHRGGSFGGQGSTRGHRGSAHVNLCSTMGTPQLQSKDMGVQCGDDDIQINLVTKLPPESFPFGEFPSVDTVATVKTLPAVRVYPLQHINVSIAGYDCVALNDSGCQIPVVSNRLFGWCREGAIGKVDLHGFGNKKLSYRRETARQLPTWRGLTPPVHSPSPLWLHLGVWLNPKATTYVCQACRP